MKEIDELVEVMEALLAPDGCPWDRAQTLDSLKPYLLEEAYEVLESMDGPPELHREELGDLLFQIVFHSALRQHKGEFSLADVARGITRKLIDRHPHVFSNGPDTHSEEIWERNKRQEKGRESFMDDIPRGLPALLRAQKIQRRASAAGFDWKDPAGAYEKVMEELDEVRSSMNDPVKLREELGDLLFAMVNWIRLLGFDAEVLLSQANRKFEGRFRTMEALARQRGDVFEDLDLDAQEELWQEAKKHSGDSRHG